MRPQMAVVCSFLRVLRSMISLLTTINLTNVLQLKCGAHFTLPFVLFLDCPIGNRDKARRFSTFLLGRLKDKREIHDNIFVATIDFNY